MFDQWRWVILLQERGVSAKRCLLSTWVWVFLGSLSLILLFLFGLLLSLRFSCDFQYRLGIRKLFGPTFHAAFQPVTLVRRRWILNVHEVVQKTTGAYADFRHRPRNSKLYVIPACAGIHSVTALIIKATIPRRASRSPV